ncbi:MAG: PDZ domain-containing protein [Candidatus Obscuribacterales bacterium]|nr:PDZ domain-containing protein [Candidatus Obscuribacterales bacterium]
MKRLRFSAKLLLLVLIAVSAALFVDTATKRATASQNHTITTRNIRLLGPVPLASARQRQDFDGYSLYKEVFESLREYSIVLTDPDVRAKWVADWEHKHADDGVLDTEGGTDEAIRAMIRSLGQRFDYYNLPKRNAQEKKEYDSSFVGIGVVLEERGLAEKLSMLRARRGSDKDLIEHIAKIRAQYPLVFVVEVYQNGPAGQAGIRAGDRITKIGKVSVVGSDMTEIAARLRGRSGSRVEISVERTSGGHTSEITFDILRRSVAAKVVRVRDLGDGLTHIQFRNFVSQFAEKEMDDALRQACKGKAIILDLRDNPGGRLDAAKTIAQYFFTQGTMLATKLRKGDTVTEIHTIVTGRHFLEKEGRTTVAYRDRTRLIVPEDMPVIVLVNEGSASASELLAGILKLRDNTLIVGKTTLGKGVGQILLELPYDRNIHVTTLEFLPGGAAMDGVGIIPDVVVDLLFADFFSEEDTQLEAARKAAIDAIGDGEDLQSKDDPVDEKAIWLLE